MSEVIINNRREKRKASGKGMSLLTNLEDDFSDIEKNFKPEIVIDFIIAPDVKNTEKLINGTDPESGKKLAAPKESTQVGAQTERDQCATRASPERDHYVTNELAERDQKIRKTEQKTKSVTSFNKERDQERDWVRDQSVTKASLERDQKKALLELSKQQDFLINYIYETCSAIGQRETPKIQNHVLLDVLKTTNGGLRTALKKLKQKQVLNIIMSKNGPSGWRIFELPEETYKHLSGQRNIERALLMRDQSVTRASLNASPRALPELPSSSSYINTTTNYKAGALAKIELTEALTMIGFNQGHIEQLLRDSSLTPEEIQNSLNAFAFDLGFEDVRRKVRSPIGLIMKLLKNGQAYISEKGYESEEDRIYRELIERADKKNEEKKNLKAKLVEIKFEEWLNDISDDDKRKLAEPIGEFMGMIHRQELKEYFKREVYNA